MVKGNSFSLWYQKYRPKTLEEYVWSSTEFKDRIQKWINDPSQLPHVILTGSPGTGKTSLLLLLTEVLGINNENLLFMNSSDDNGINAARQVREFCENSGWSNLRIVILDEAERLTRDAQEALRSTMDGFGETVRFFFSCNEISRIRAPIQSRARIFKIQEINKDQFLNRLVYIAYNEGIDIENEENILQIIKLGDEYWPNMRKTIDMMQDSVNGNMLNSKITEEVNTQTWEIKIISYLLGEINLHDIRLEIDSLRPDEIESAYRFLYENSGDLFGESEEKCIKSIFDHLKVHPETFMPALGLIDCLIECKKSNLS